MKSIILILSMLLSLTSCSDDDVKPQENDILGTWKLIETYGSDGGSNPQWTAVNNGYTYTFNNDGTLISDRFTCNGSYSLLSQNQVTISFDCADSQFNLVYNFTFKNQYLILTPNLSNCDEGCGDKYEKTE